MWLAKEVDSLLPYAAGFSSSEAPLGLEARLRAACKLIQSEAAFGKVVGVVVPVL